MEKSKREVSIVFTLVKNGVYLVPLTLTMLRKISVDDILKWFLFSKKIGFDISCRLSPKDNYCEMSKHIFWEK